MAAPKALHSPRFQRQIERIVAMGARPVAELLIEAVGDQQAQALVERYARLDPGIIRALGADVFPPLPDLRIVGGQRHG